jgi:hypothetical protein
MKKQKSFEKEEIKKLLQKLDEFMNDPKEKEEMIKRAAKLDKNLSYISIEDLFKPFTI